MESESRAEEPRPILCPLCEVNELRLVGANVARCDPCEYAMGGELIGTLRGMARLPEAVGRHACECGYPEMRLLPDGVFHCPACGSEITPVGASVVEWKTADHPESYWQGWLDGRYPQGGKFGDSPRLARWEEAGDRLEYHRGHSAGGFEREEARANRSVGG